MKKYLIVLAGVALVVVGLVIARPFSPDISAESRPYERYSTARGTPLLLSSASKSAGIAFMLEGGLVPGDGRPAALRRAAAVVDHLRAASLDASAEVFFDETVITVTSKNEAVWSDFELAEQKLREPIVGSGQQGKADALVRRGRDFSESTLWMFPPDHPYVEASTRRSSPEPAVTSEFTVEILHALVQGDFARKDLGDGLVASPTGTRDQVTRAELAAHSFTTQNATKSVSLVWPLKTQLEADVSCWQAEVVEFTAILSKSFPDEIAKGTLTAGPEFGRSGAVFVVTMFGDSAWVASLEVKELAQALATKELRRVPSFDTHIPLSQLVRFEHYFHPSLVIDATPLQGCSHFTSAGPLLLSE